MAKGKKYGGQQGESISKPAMVGSNGGAYASSANTMGGASSPNEQEWNGYRMPKSRDASVKKSGGNSDY